MKYLTDINLNQNELQNGVIQNVSGNVSTPKAGQIWFDSSNGVKKLKYYDGTNTLIIGESTISSNSTSQSVPTTQAVASFVGDAIAATDAMVFKGTLGTGGTITALPTTYETGWTYRIITAGTYAGQACEVGDLIIAIVDRSGSGNLDSDWTVAQTNIGGAATETPLMDGVAAVGTSTKYAREDHVHPSDTSRVPTSRTVNGHALSSNVEVTNLDLGQGSAYCNTASSTAAKTASLTNFVLKEGGIVAVEFEYAVPANASLNINSTGAKDIYWNGSAITANVIKGGYTATFIYDGVRYVLLTVDRSAVLVSSSNDGLMSYSDKQLIESSREKCERLIRSNPALTSTSGVCTWTISEAISGYHPDMPTIVQVFDSSGNMVMPDINVTRHINMTPYIDVVITIASSTNISADTYKAVIVY